jgi:GrpB-like predicted nucleotidyltransferase (UPF0157 family)
MIVICPYKPTWPREFETIRGHLFSALGEQARRIAHIGSTAVPGLGAKDIIDIQVGVDGLDPDIASRLSSAGYAFVARHDQDHVPPGDPGPPDRWKKLYFRGAAPVRPCHIHVRDRQNPNHRYALLFRDYLRAHPGARMTIEVVKRELARLHGDDADAYYAVKDPVYDLVWQAATEWAAFTAWSQDAATDA